MTHIELLKQNPLVRALSTVQLINYFALMFTQVAVFTLLARNDAGALEMGFVAAIFWMPSIIISPFSGILADRFPPQKLLPVLLCIEILATLSFLGATEKEDFLLLLILLFIRSSAGVMYFTATMSLLPKVIGGESLKQANEIHSVVYSFCLTAGMALGGIIVAYLGIKEAFLIDAGLYLFGLAILLKAQIPEIQAHKERFFAMLKEGILYLLGEKKILFLMAIHAVIATTLFDAVVTLLAKNHYSTLIAIPLAIGFINAARSLASVLAPLFIGKYANDTTIGYFILVESLFLFIWAYLANDFYMSLVGAFLSGLLLTTIWAYTMTMIQERVESRFYGRVIAYNDMFFTSVAVGSSVFIGFLLESGASERLTLAYIGVVFLIVGGIYIRFKERIL